MTKKYRTKTLHSEVVVHTENGPNNNYPVVFSYRASSGAWCPCYSKPLSHPDCVVEEVPEEPIKVGYEFKHDGQMCKVVYQLAGNAPHYVVTRMAGREELLRKSPDDRNLWNEHDIREAEASD